MPRGNSAEKSFLFTARPVIELSKILGLLPVTIKQNQGKCIAEISSNVQVYSVIAALITNSGCFFEVFTLFVTYQSQRLLQIYFTGRFLIYAFIHIICLKNSRRILDVMNEVSQLGITFPKATARVFLSTTLIKFASDIAWGIRFKLIKKYEIPVNVFPLYSGTIVFLLFGFKAGSLQLAVKRLNEELLQQLQTSNTRRDLSLRSVLCKHTRLRAVCAHLNAAYGTLMLLATVGALSEITYGLFSCYNYLSMATNAMECVCIIIWFISICAPAIITMLVCQGADNEFQKTKNIYLNLKTSDEDLYDEREMREWEVQLKQQPIRFSANGFFDINAGQLKTVFRTIITYFVILVQNWIKLY